MPEYNDEALAKLVLGKRKATPEQLAGAKELAAKMRGLGLEKDVLDALVEQGVVSAEEAVGLRGAVETMTPVAPEPFAVTVEGGPAPGQGRQGPRCANHPYTAGIFRCAVCGKNICTQCAVRTSRGIYCSEECSMEADGPRDTEGGIGELVAALPVKRIAVGFAVLVLAVLVLIRTFGPSAELRRARRLKAAVLRLEGEGWTKEALAAAEELASVPMATSEIELKRLIDWGEGRVDMLRIAAARAELDVCLKGMPALETLDRADLVRYRREFEKLGEKHSKLPPLRTAADKLVVRIDRRLARVEVEGRAAVVSATLASAKALVDEAGKEAEALVKESRYGEACAAVEGWRSRLPEALKGKFAEKLDRLKASTLHAARVAYKRKDVRAKDLVWRKRFDEAEEIYRGVIETFGVEEITEKARKSLDGVRRVRGGTAVAAKRGDLVQVARALALIEERLRALDYVGAKLEIERVSPSVRRKDAKARLETIAESVRRDEEAFLAILEMIRKGPLKLSEIRRAGTGEIVEADSTGYTVRVDVRRSGRSSYKMSWSKMPGPEICGLAQMAAGDDVDSLVDLALFCAGRGAYQEYLRAKDRIQAHAPVDDPLARFAVRFKRLEKEAPQDAGDRPGGEEAVPEVQTPAAGPPPAEEVFTSASTPVPENGSFGDYHALVIGIDGYRALPRLRTAMNDARSVARTLKEDYGFRTRLLLDATRADILNALGEFRRELTPHDNLLIYYAGHGWLDEEADQGYWFPVDATRDSEVNWVSNAFVTSTVKAIQAKHVLVVADSCYSGKLTRGIHVKRRTPGYFARMARKKARLVLSSGGLEPVADAGGERRHSVFASAFLQALRENEGVIDGTQLFTLIRRPVMVNSDQTPEYADIHKAGHAGGDFLFVREK